MRRSWRLLRVWFAYRRFEREYRARWDRLTVEQQDELTARTILYGKTSLPVQGDRWHDASRDVTHTS